jgi:hypothetical protein
MNEVDDTLVIELRARGPLHLVQSVCKVGFRVSQYLVCWLLLDPKVVLLEHLDRSHLTPFELYLGMKTLQGTVSVAGERNAAQELAMLTDHADKG